MVPSGYAASIHPARRDSALVAAADSVQSSEESKAETRSLTASITDYPTYWGRRYHRYKEGSYLFPNDDSENSRLDMQHEILRRLHGRLFFAPLDPARVHTVLDLGTGTGIWPIELADADVLPHATITGVDLSAVQPLDVPANVHFEIQDCSEDDWLRPPASVDFCHVRLMAGSLTSYRALIRTARHYLRPGSGWLECHELHPSFQTDDDTIPADWPLTVWDDNFDYAATQSVEPPRPVRVAPQIQAWMEREGYVDVHQRVVKIPLGSWPKDKRLKRIGGWWANNWVAALPGLTYKLFGADGLQWTREEIEVMLAEVRKAAFMKEVHAYQRYYVVCGRRPSRDEEDARDREGDAPRETHVA